jgi:hypothetical protein
MADAAVGQGVLHGAVAVELNPVTQADAASYPYPRLAAAAL